MTSMAKAVRRIEAERRAKARALRRLKASQPSVLADPAHAAVAAGRMARTPTTCSCTMCGNPRKHAKGQWRETLAEAKARLDEKDGCPA